MNGAAMNFVQMERREGGEVGAGWRSLLWTGDYLSSADASISTPTSTPRKDCARLKAKGPQCDPNNRGVCGYVCVMNLPSKLWAMFHLYRHNYSFRASPSGCVFFLVGIINATSCCLETCGLWRSILSGSMAKKTNEPLLPRELELMLSSLSLLQ